MNADLTVYDVIKLVHDRAQWCRKNGESDMRNIINLVHYIESEVKGGKTREEIISYWKEDE